MEIMIDAPTIGIDKVSPRIRMIRKALSKWFIVAPCSLSDGRKKK